MARSSEPTQLREEVPLYVRWSPDRSAYNIELRLDLVAKIAAQVNLSEKLGIEVGGFLIGSFPTADVPTIRIEDVDMVTNGSDDDTVFLPEPGEYLRFSAGNRRKPGRELDTIGFFRTHARVGPLRPSPVDRSILAQQFGTNPYLVLLIQARGRHEAAFFVSTNGQLPAEPSVREFEFDEREFKSLPEVTSDGAGDAEILTPKTSRRLKIGPYATIAALLLIAIGACALMWSFARQAIMPGAANQLHLQVAPEDHVAQSSLLRITWDHSARELSQATGGTLIITDSGGHSEIPLGLDDLRLGAVEYNGAGAKVGVQMMLNTPGGQILGDSAEWNSQ